MRGGADRGNPVNDDLRQAVLALKRERIVTVAAEMFHRQGFDHTTLDQVALRLKVTKPFIYAHFRSKSELLAAVCVQGIDAALRAIDRVLGGPGSPRDWLAAFAHDFLLAVFDRQQHIAVYTREEKHLDVAGRQSIESMRREFDRKLTGLLDAGVASGEFDIAETPVAALAIGGMVSWASVWFRPDGRLSSDQVARKMSKLVMAMSRSSIRAATLAQRGPRNAGTYWRVEKNA